jgi:hypothetical protein
VTAPGPIGRRLDQLAHLLPGAAARRRLARVETELVLIRLGVEAWAAETRQLRRLAMSMSETQDPGEGQVVPGREPVESTGLPAEDPARQGGIESPPAPDGGDDPDGDDDEAPAPGQEPPSQYGGPVA